MTHLFTNEEMREGSVEPKETHPSKGKKALDQTKINVIKSGYALIYSICSNHYRKSDTGQERKIEIQFSSKPLHFSFHSCPLKYYLPNRCAMFIPYLISTSKITEANFTCPPDHQPSIFTCPRAKCTMYLSRAIRPWFFLALNYIIFPLIVLHGGHRRFKMWPRNLFSKWRKVIFPLG